MRPPDRSHNRGDDEFAQLVLAVREVLKIAGAVPGLTTAEVAARYRVNEDKVRGWITSGVLRAVNTSDKTTDRPRYVVPAEALAEFEQAKGCAPAPKPPRRRRAGGRDYFPD